MKNSKLSNSDSAYLVCFVKFYENCLQTNNKQTNKQQSRFNNVDISLSMVINKKVNNLLKT